VAPQYTLYTGITREDSEGYVLSAATRRTTCAFFASTACPISAGSLSRPRATQWRWSVWRGTRKVVEPRCRARVSTCRVSLMSITAGRLRRWRELRPVERQRWRKEGELRMIETYPAAARGSKHVREQVIGARHKMGQCNPRWMSRRPVGWR
jgi:hypothetical protein